jgi:hypothetical protein
METGRVASFTIGGRTFSLTRGDVERALEGLEPEPLRGRAKYYIEYKGRRYPIKQVVAAATGLSRMEFTAMHAHKILGELGFEVKELGRGWVKASPEEDYYSQRLAKRLGKASPDEAVWEVLKNPDRYPEDARRILILAEEFESDGYRTVESRPRFLDGKVNFFTLEKVREGPRIKTKMAIVPEEPYAIVALERVRHEPKFKFEKELVSIYAFVKDSWRTMQLT